MVIPGYMWHLVYGLYISMISDTYLWYYLRHIDNVICCAKVHALYLTIIWVASRTLFGRYLLGCLWTYRHQSSQGGSSQLLTKKWTDEQRIWRQFYHTIIFHQFGRVRVREEPHWQGASIINSTRGGGSECQFPLQIPLGGLTWTECTACIEV